jgi:hypothetical protein
VLSARSINSFACRPARRGPGPINSTRESGRPQTDRSRETSRILGDLGQGGFRSAGVYQYRLEVAEANGVELSGTFLQARPGDVDADVSFGEWGEVYGIGAAATSPFDNPSGRLGHA